MVKNRNVGPHFPQKSKFCSEIRILASESPQIKTTIKNGNF